MRAALLVLIAFLSAAPALGQSPAPSSTTPLRQSADLILYGGKVFTADPARPWAEAIAITGDRITAVGSNATVRSQAGPATRMFDVLCCPEFAELNHYRLKPVGFPNS